MGAHACVCVCVCVHGIGVHWSGYDTTALDIEVDPQRCRFLSCGDAELLAMPQEDLAKLHEKHVTSLAHLELALGALDDMPTGGPLDYFINPIRER